MRCQPLRVLKAWQPTLRIRLALWAMGLLFLTALGLTLFINVTTAVVASPPNTIAVPIAVPEGETLERIAVAPAGEVAAESPTTDGHVTATDGTDVLRSMRLVSAIGIGVVVVLGGAGSYWLAGRALRPLRAVSQAAQGISTGTLGTRLVSDGPDDELKELTEALNALLARLDRAFEQQRRFVSDAAHEFRTPLTTLRINLEPVLWDSKVSTQDKAEIAAASERALGRLELLIDDLLLLATEDRTVAHDEVALGPLLEDVALDLRSPAERNGTVLHVGGEIDVMLRGEESLLRRAFSNLIENAICYNRAGGEVEVSVGTEGGWAVIAISDNGIGIPLEDQPHIFERFYRVDRSRGQHPGGVGLGLAIVADVVRRHGGTIEVKSVASIGSTFTVRLPL